jgi:hypothetical protein
VGGEAGGGIVSNAFMDTLHLAAVPSPRRCDVALLGFTKFERAAQVAFFRSEAALALGLHAVDDMAQADFVVADGDDPATVLAVVAAERTHQTVFIGGQAPAEAMSWMHRPIDPRRVIRALAAMVDLDADEIVTSRASCFGSFEGASGW